MRLDGDSWDKAWDNLTKRAWRLETQPVYTMPSEADQFERWKRGEEIPPSTAWLDFIEQSTKAGVYFGRVRVLEPPLPEYVRFQFDVGYRPTIPVGHDVRILDLSRTPNPGLPSEDFWLLDDQIVRMLYRPDGTQIGRELVEDPAELPKFERWMQLAIEHSVPFDEYDS